MGNLPPIQDSWPAYAAIFLMPLKCGSRTYTASLRSASMTSRSCLNMSGCWSYLLEMYCFIASEREMEFVLRKGRERMLLRMLALDFAQTSDVGKLTSPLLRKCSF